MLQSSVALEVQTRLSKTGTAVRQREVKELHRKRSALKHDLRRLESDERYKRYV